MIMPMMRSIRRQCLLATLLAVYKLNLARPFSLRFKAIQMSLISEFTIYGQGLILFVPLLPQTLLPPSSSPRQQPPLPFR